MTLADFATDRPVQFTPAHRFGIVFQWLATRRATRAKRVALQSLLFAPDHRLRDLGISRDELIKALDARK